MTRYSILIFTTLLICIFGKPTGENLIRSYAESLTCRDTPDCNNGKCRVEVEIVNGMVQTTHSKCECDKGYINDEDGEPCVVEQKDKLAAFLLSFILGYFGADWFYLSHGAAGYIAAGILKLTTFGGFGIWWSVDWIRILCDSFSDSYGVYPAWLNTN